jgi:hypothetical protein
MSNIACELEDKHNTDQRIPSAQSSPLSFSPFSHMAQLSVARDL